MRSDKNENKKKTKKTTSKKKNSTNHSHKTKLAPTASRKELGTLKKNNNKKRILLTILFTCVIGLISYAAYFAIAANKAVEDIQGESLSSTSENPRPKPVALKDKEPFSVLLLGVDERVDDSGRSDSILVATVNPDKGSVKLVSIPRDTLVDIPNYGKDKINAAFAYGGINLAVQTVEKYLNLPINYYTKINMEGMIELVDAVGGINVDNKYAFELDGVELDVGNFDLDGNQALQYARMRKQDPAGDFGRQERQREVISKIAKKALGITSLTNFNKIFNALGKNIETNLTGSELWELAKNYAGVANNIESVKLEGPDGSLYYIPSYGQEVYVWQPSAESLQEVSNQLREHLGLADETTVPDTETAAPANDSSTESYSTTTEPSNSYYEEPYVPYVPPAQSSEPVWSQEPTPAVETPVVPDPAPDSSSSVATDPIPPVVAPPAEPAPTPEPPTEGSISASN